jgi:hypothetical protein
MGFPLKCAVFQRITRNKAPILGLFRTILNNQILRIEFGNYNLVSTIPAGSPRAGSLPGIFRKMGAPPVPGYHNRDEWY